MYFSLSDEWKVVQAVRTDNDGKFACDLLPPGKYWIGPAPEGTVEEQHVAPYAICVDIPGPEERQLVVIRAAHNIYVRGQIVTKQGMPVSGVTVVAHPEHQVAGEFPQTRSGIDGLFELGPLPAERIMLTATHADSLNRAESASAMIENLAEFVRIELRRVPIVRIRVDNSRDDEVLSALASSHGNGEYSYHSVRDRGFRNSCVIEGLEEGLWNVMISSNSGRTGILRELTIGNPPADVELHVTIEDGGILECTNPSSEKPVHITVVSDNVLAGVSRVEANGRFEVIVPTGKATVYLRSDNLERIVELVVHPRERLSVSCAMN